MIAACFESPAGISWMVSKSALMEITLSCLPVPHFVLLPACTVTLHLGPLELRRQVELAGQTRGLICLVEAGHYARGDSLVGCLAEVTRVTRQATGWNVLFTGLRRLALSLEMRTDRGLLVRGHELPGRPWCSGESPSFDRLPPSLAALRDQVDPAVWLDIAGFHLPLEVALRQRLLAEPDPNLRAGLLRQVVYQEADRPRCSAN
jgi:hypothetical protein